MVFLPTDFSSFAWGALVGAAAAFATGFLMKAGEHAFVFIAGKVKPKPLEPVQVDGRFVPTRFTPAECAWINEVKLYEYEEKGYTYYPHPKSNARCYRLTSDGRHPIKEFLLVSPGAKEITNA
jgi:hypothetical protein